MNTKTLGTDESALVKSEIEKRLKALEVTVEHKRNRSVVFLAPSVSSYEITVTDGVAYARQEIGEHHLGGPQQSAFLDRVAAGLVQLFAAERYLVVKRGE